MKAISKILLFGEHSVVYGKKAIALPIKKLTLKVYVQKEKCKEHEHVKYIKELLGIKDYVKVKTNIPLSRGLGSSAALAVAMARLKNVDEYEISSLAEKKAHGNPSGVDANVIINEKALIFQKNSKNEEIDIDLSAYLLIIDTGIKSSTKEAVLKVKKSGKMDVIEKLGIITEEAICAIKEKDVYKLAKLMKKAQQNLKELGLSTKYIDSLIRKINYYALGSKITGAGLGGCLIALCEKKEKALKLQRMIRKKGIKNSWIIKV